MDSEDEMQQALGREEAKQKWLKAADGNSDEPIDESPDFNLPAKPEKTTIQFDIYGMVADLMNRLELLGENLISYSDEVTGETELSGKSHTIKYDPESDQWCIVPGRKAAE